MDHQDTAFFAPGSGNILAAFVGGSLDDDVIADAENAAPTQSVDKPAARQRQGGRTAASAGACGQDSSTRDKKMSKKSVGGPLTSVENKVRGEDVHCTTSTSHTRSLTRSTPLPL